MDFPLFYLVFLLNEDIKVKLDLYNTSAEFEHFKLQSVQERQDKQRQRTRKKRETVNVSSKSQNAQDRLSVVEMKGTTQEQHTNSFVMRKSGDTLPQRLWVPPLLSLLLQAACLLSKEGRTEKTHHVRDSQEVKDTSKETIWDRYDAGHKVLSQELSFLHCTRMRFMSCY